MLKNAKDYQKEILNESIWINDKENYKYYIFNKDNHITLYNKEPYREFVSIDNENNVIGFMRFYIKDNIAMNVETICFNEDETITYGLDIIELFKKIFIEEKLVELRFSVNEEYEELNEKYQSMVSKGFGVFLFNKNGYNFYKLTKSNYLNYNKKYR